MSSQSLTGPFSTKALGKYVTLDGLGKILKSQSLLWSRASRFNDPFDCLLPLSMAPPLHISRVGIKREFYKVIASEVKSFALSSPLSRLMNNLQEMVAQGHISADQAWATHFDAVQAIYNQSDHFVDRFNEMIVGNMSDWKLLCLSKNFRSILI